MHRPSRINVNRDILQAMILSVRSPEAVCVNLHLVARPTSRRLAILANDGTADKRTDDDERREQCQAFHSANLRRDLLPTWA